MWKLLHHMEKLYPKLSLHTWDNNIDFVENFKEDPILEDLDADGVIKLKLFCNEKKVKV
jgi:hypothetical protein